MLNYFRIVVVKIILDHMTLHPMTMYRPTITDLHSSHDQMLTPPTAYYNSHVLSSGHTTNDWSSYQRTSNTGIISQNILKDSVKVLYLFQALVTFLQTPI